MTIKIIIGGIACLGVGFYTRDIDAYDGDVPILNRTITASTK